ncbi:MAG: metallophosphoesterase [Desulfobacterales bacterium]|jgi:DNA repair exonuclease SbcCD nuclease subunit
MGIIRILLIADTHLGFDLPFRPRIQRRRRGPEFFANFEHALKPALNGKVDAVFHGGDVLYRSKVPVRLVEMAFEPLKRVAQTGVPVYLVPGNHERSAIPHGHLAEHPGIHLFDRPRTFTLQTKQGSLALAGFPFVRSAIRKHFLDLVEQTGWWQKEADVSVLCVHQSVDGATVGPAGYTFRYAHDVIRSGDIPGGFAAVLAGHIHRFQVLTEDLRGRPLKAPVFYPGSIERTSFAEKEEPKGYLILEFETSKRLTAGLKHWTFHELPTRPMIQLDLNAAEMSAAQIQSWIQSSLYEMSPDSIVKLKVHGKISPEAMAVFRAPALRALAPQTMNIEATLLDHIVYANRHQRK